MSYFQAAILGIVQGLTEFLPISSSGHLIIFQHLFGLTEPELLFDISVHVGTLAAVIIFFRQDIRSILTAVAEYFVSLFRQKKLFPETKTASDLRFAFLIVIGTIPTGIIGLLIKKKAEVIFSSVTLVGCMLLITGLLLWFTRRIANSENSQLSVKDALIIGIVQGLAVMPGISRSGSTISAGLFLGFSRETSAKFSFLLSIPAILGAELLGLKDIIGNPASFESTMIIGTLTAGFVGYGALKLLMMIVHKGQLHIFAPYCGLAAVIAFGIGYFL